MPGLPLAARPEDAETPAVPPSAGAPEAVRSPSLIDRLHDRWCTWRDRVLTSPSFQRRAARSWWMRPIARRRARTLFDLVAGFVYSQVLYAAVRVRLFDVLKDGPLPLAEVARRTGLPPEGAERLLQAAAALELIEARSRSRWGLGPLGAAMVGHPGIGAMVEHHAVLYADLKDPVGLLQGTVEHPALSQFWAYASTTAPGELAREQVSAYSAVMSASQPLIADEVLDSYPLHRHRCLLDVGGGEGRFLVAAGLRTPGLQLKLFDLPSVGSAASLAFEQAGLADRASIHGGDFTRDALPTGADIASLVRVIYDHPDERALTILRAVHRALPPGGTLLLAEPMAGARGAARMGQAYFGFYLLAMHGGRSRTASELGALLQAAGFERVREWSTAIPLQVGLLVARKPAVVSS